MTYTAEKSKNKRKDIAFTLASVVYRFLFLIFFSSTQLNSTEPNSYTDKRQFVIVNNMLNHKEPLSQ